jgi:hypothetical protein
VTPQEDARILLALVDRHLRALRLNLDPAFPDEEWGFTAQQAVEKLLKARIVLADQRPPFTQQNHPDLTNHPPSPPCCRCPSFLAGAT